MKPSTYYFLMKTKILADFKICISVLLKVILDGISALIFSVIVIFYAIFSPGNITMKCRSSRPEVFLFKGVLKIYSKFTGEHSCQSEISVKLQSNFIEITLRNGCSPVNLLHIFRTHFYENTSGCLLL